ncbi:60S ribosomal protein L34 [Lemmus lemmus]
MRLSKTVKHVSRAYSGSKCSKCVQNWIKWAFLIEEQKNCCSENVEGTSTESSEINMYLFKIKDKAWWKKGKDTNKNNNKKEEERKKSEPCWIFFLHFPV